MIDVIKSIKDLSNAGVSYTIATVVNTWRSSPRPVGSMMVVNPDGEMTGSVSGGCVEGSIVKLSADVLGNGKGTLKHFGVTDDSAWEVGLSCGGALDVWIEPIDTEDKRKIWLEMVDLIASNQSTVLVRDLEKKGGGTIFSMTELSNSPLDMAEEIKRAMVERVSFRNDSTTKFYHSFPAKRKMILIGSAHITIDLVSLASSFDFMTTVIDPRDTFAKSRYSAAPDELIVAWPQEVLPDVAIDEETYAVILSHDPKIDDQALKILLKSKARYIGALGSKKTHQKRRERLEEYGFTSEEIDRIDAPVGLDIHAKFPKEIALSIIAAVISRANE